jgi:hypothetical protein
MWRRRLTIAAVALAAAAGTSAGTARVAHAGALAAVERGIAKAAGDDGKSGSGGSGSDRSDTSHDESKSSSSWTDWSCCSSRPGATMGYAYASEPSSVLPTSGGVHSELYVGAQSVTSSDASMTLELRASYEDFGVGVRGTTFFEQAEVPMNKPAHLLRLDLWWVGGSYRLDHDENSSVWVELGFTGLNSDDRVSLSGGELGVRASHRLGGLIVANVGARHFELQDDVGANEVFGGLQASILQVTYRVVDFNVGPPLYGPEVGLAFSF